MPEVSGEDFLFFVESSMTQKLRVRTASDRERGEQPRIAGTAGEVAYFLMQQDKSGGDAHTFV